MRLANTILLWGTLITTLLIYPLGYAATKYGNVCGYILAPAVAIVAAFSGFFAVLACIYGLISIAFPKRCKSGFLLPIISVILGAVVLLTVFIIPTWRSMNKRAEMEQLIQQKESQQGGPGYSAQGALSPDP